MDKSQEIVKQDEKSVEKTHELYEATPAVDIYENDNEILLHADMPGVVKENISVDIDNDGIANSEDNCPLVVNLDQLDADGDGAGEDDKQALITAVLTD